MAKPLSLKSKLIREAIVAHPKLGNTKLAALMNASDERKQDNISVDPGDVSQQRLALKKVTKLKGVKKKTSDNGVVPSAPAEAKPGKSGPVELVERVIDLAKACGGVEQLKRLVDSIAEAK